MNREVNLPLLLTCHPSKLLRRIVVFLYLLALVASIANGLNLFIKMSLFILIVLYFRIGVRRLNDINYRIKYSDALGWALSEGEEFVTIDIIRSTVITTQMLFLHFNYASNHSKRLFNKQTLLILNDQLTVEDYRSLVVKLKITVIK